MGDRLLFDVYIGNLSANIKENDLCFWFSTFGEVIRVKFFTSASVSGNGYAFISYDDLNSCHEAIQKLNGYIFDGLKLKVNAANAKLKTGLRTLMVTNFDPMITRKSMIEDYFLQFGGTVTSIRMKPNGALVQFERSDQAEDALRKSHAIKLGNQRIMVKYAAFDVYPLTGRFVRDEERYDPTSADNAEGSSTYLDTHQRSPSPRHDKYHGRSRSPKRYYRSRRQSRSLTPKRKRSRSRERKQRQSRSREPKRSRSSSPKRRKYRD